MLFLILGTALAFQEPAAIDNKQAGETTKTATVIQTPPAATPKLSTADMVAITTFEKAKKETTEQFKVAARGEQQVILEWQANHPGFTVDPRTFTVVPMGKGAENKPLTTDANTNKKPAGYSTPYVKPARPANMPPAVKKQ